MEVIGNKVSIATTDNGAAKVVVHYTLRALTWLIVATAMLVWLIIGFIFWVPLLVRAAVAFSVEVVNATLTDRAADAAGLMLSRAVNFYRSGFVIAIEAIQDPPAGRKAPRTVHGIPDDDEYEMGIDVRSLLNEVGWTVLIWYFAASLLGWTLWTPAYAVSEFFSIEWGRHLGILWYSITSWIGSFGF